MDNEIERVLKEAEVEAQTIFQEDRKTQEQKDVQKCTRLLRDRCPACFGGNVFGRSLNE